MLRSFLSHTPQRFYEADKGLPATGATEPITGNDPVITDDKKFSQADVDAIVKDRIARAQRKADEAAAKAKSEAEQKALAEQGEFKTLAEQRASELAALSAQLEAAKTHELTAEKYRKALKDKLAIEKAAFPAHVVALLDKLDPIEQMEWITTNAEALKPASSTPVNTLGTPPRNTGNGARNTTAPTRQSSVASDDRKPFTLG